MLNTSTWSNQPPSILEQVLSLEIIENYGFDVSFVSDQEADHR
jgi:hypothetical protein